MAEARSEARDAWWREDLLRRVLRNTGLLGAGKAAGAILHLAGLVLTARLLGPAGFGMLMLVRSYAQSASALAKFQSWQTLIHFGAARADARDRSGLRDLAAYTIAMDAATGLVAAILAAAFVPALGPRLGIGPAALALAQLYCLAVPLLASATPTGLLRIFDRFDHLAWQSVVTPTVRLGGIGAAALGGAPLQALVLAWLMSDLVGELFLWLQAWREMRRRGFAGGRRPSVRRALRENVGLLRFSLASNASATLGHALAPLFTLFVGALLGSAAAGLYRIAQMLLDAVSAPAELAMRSFFPEVTRLRARDATRFGAIVARMVLLSAALGLTLALVAATAGPWLLVAAMGAGYAPIGTTLRIVAIGFVPVLAVFPLETALLAMGRAGSILVARIVGAIVAFGAAAILAGRFALPGVGLAAVLGFIAAFAAMAAGASPVRRH